LQQPIVVLIKLQEHALQLDEILDQDALQHVSISARLKVFETLRKKSRAHHPKDCVAL
jgi:hypothetical protein